VTDLRSIPELRAHADKVPGYGHLVAHEMVDEIEESRERLEKLDDLLKRLIWDWGWEDVAEYRLKMMRTLRKKP
jgi:hypothetical protein